MATGDAQPNTPELPRFGGDNGIIFPLFAHLLAACTWLTVPRFFNLRSTATDVYILVCFAIGVGVVIAADCIIAGHIFLYLACAFASWRLFELLSVTLFEFCAGSYRGRSTKPLNRVVCLKLVNLLELITLFGLCYYLPGKFGEEWMSQRFESAFDAVYFSTVTAATLGYGDLYPKHWALKALVIAEVLFFVLIGLSLLSVLRSRAPLLADDFSPKADAASEIFTESRPS